MSGGRAVPGRVAWPFVLVVALLLAAWLALPVRAESRWYPYAGVTYNAETGGHKGRPWAELGTSWSAGRFAPSVTGRLTTAGSLDAGVEFRVRYKIGHGH